MYVHVQYTTVQSYLGYQAYIAIESSGMIQTPHKDSLQKQRKTNQD